MKSRDLRSFAAVLILLGAFGAGLSASVAVGAASDAEAHPRIADEHWTMDPIGYYDITTNYSGNVVSRRIDFNSAVAEVSIADQGASSGEVQISDYDYGHTGWPGLCSRGVDEEWFDRWDYVDLNEHYMDGQTHTSYTGNKNSAVVAHEFGHCFGALTHHEATGVVMQGTINDFYDTDGVWGIDSTTADEIDDLYES